MMTDGRSGVSRAAEAAVVSALVVASALLYVYAGGLVPTSGTTATASPLISFSADAYAAETTSLLESFSQSTGVPVAPVSSGGSFADANQIAAGAPDDVFVSVSIAATGAGYLEDRSPGWAVGFASDQMVVAYSNGTAGAAVAALGQKAAKSNATSEWSAFFDALTSGSVKVGVADPAADPAGLRGWLVLEAAGYLYSDGNQSAYSSALLASGSNVTGTHAAALVPALEAGRVQFLFIYRSAAVADGLPYIPLASRVNFGSPSLAGYYAQFSYADSAGVQRGSPIVLCVTVPLGSADMANALRFVGFVVDNSGTLSGDGLQPLTPARLYNDTEPPSAIAQLVAQGSVVPAGAL